jgi:hypothetical protein
MRVRQQYAVNTRKVKTTSFLNPFELYACIKQEGGLPIVDFVTVTATS